MLRRRTLLTAAVAAGPVGLAAASTPAAADSYGGHHGHGHGRGGLPPVRTSEADWQPVADVLGRTGTLSGGTVYRVGFPRRDLSVTSYEVRVAAGLSLGSYAAFAKYPDRKSAAMGDLVVTEPELGPVTDALHAHDTARIRPTIPSLVALSCWSGYLRMH